LVGRLNQHANFALPAVSFSEERRLALRSIHGLQ
jgi:hypothetical protein